MINNSSLIFVAALLFFLHIQEYKMLWNLSLFGKHKKLTSFKRDTGTHSSFGLSVEM